MQLVSNDIHKEDISECDPILCQSDLSQRSIESSSSCEITTLRGDCDIIDEDLHDLEVDENSQLVNEQPQCRICLEIGGPYFLSCSVPFFFSIFSFTVTVRMVKLIFLRNFNASPDRKNYNNNNN